MTDANWPACCVVATVLWFLAVVLAIADLFFVRDDIGYMGIIAACAGATINVRRWFREQDRATTAAFELGREAGVRSIR